MSVELRRYSGDEVRADGSLRARLGEIYQDAFGQPPHNHNERDGASWAEDGLVRHAGYPGFGLVTAERDGEVLGFAYGLIGTNEQWFTMAMRRMLPPAVTDAWLTEDAGHGELVELAVVGAAQGQGIGARLHDAVLTDLRATGADRALLIAHRDAAPARALYGARGWQVVAEPEPTSVLMGIRLAEPAAGDEPHPRS